MSQLSFSRFRKLSFRNRKGVAAKLSNLENMFNNHKHAVIQLDRFGRATFTNKLVREMFTYDTEEMLLDHIIPFLEPEKETREDYLELALSGEAQCYQAEVNHKDARRLSVEVSYLPVLDKHSKVENILVFIKDISKYRKDKKEDIVSSQIKLEKELRKSIENKELVLHYQPRVSTTGEIMAAEALVRWNHSERGLIPPSEFIPLAEEIGFIDNIGDWVLEQVCSMLNIWKQAKIDVVPISINISAQRFLKKDWKDTILTILEQYAINPELIELEITETTLIKYEEIVYEALCFLKKYGIKVALDDFGTGFSSLTYIYKFPIDTIKIDRSFVNQLTSSKDAAAIIKSVIFMAKELDLNLVAEGVETPEQLAFLIQQECQEIQGYLYSKAVPEEKFFRILKKRVLTPGILVR